jgi:hypothetical protein
LATLARISSFMTPSTRLVSVVDGAMQFTRTPLGPSSLAAWRVSMTMPALADA